MNSFRRPKWLSIFTVILAVVFVSALPVSAGGGGKKRHSAYKQTQLWQQVNKSKLQSEIRENTGLPEKYLVFRLDRTSLKNTLNELALENTESAREKDVVMEIPMPDGTLQRFRVEETAVLSAELAADFPDWKTFQGYNTENPAIKGRFDWNALGFHGYISTEKGTVYIDPLQKGSTENYIVFYKHEFGAADNSFYCRAEQKTAKLLQSEISSQLAPSAPAFSFGATTRTYRLAVATTGEWARAAAGYNGTQTPLQIRNAALAVIMTAVNRLNGIYLRELASQFQLVNPATNNNAANIIFDDPATDPYDNTDSTAQLTINQTTVDNRVGAASYDIGHLFGTGGGGVASSPSLCSTQKAEGYSARGTNTGDPFIVDYVAHEMGHQFGANHTYNNADSSGACTTRNAATAFEVASGATLMSYVGICNARNLQQYVDTGTPSFHIISLTEITNNVTTGDPAMTGCGTASGSNSVPTVNTAAAYTIPKLTPFTLTSIASDGNGDSLLYSWEEYDAAPSPSGEQGVPPGTYDVDTDGVLRPLLRAYSPVSSDRRTFPSLPFILNPQNNDQTVNVNGVASNQPVLTYTGTHPTGAPGAVCESGQTCVMGERLPTQTRTMNFRVSVRDGKGGVRDNGTNVNVVSGAGPFQVTTQNASPTTWNTGTTQTVTWDVAGTTGNGINAANVNILLSLDGGQNFIIALKNNTPNDGTETITVPSNTTTQARIKVEAVGNIFFDINNANFAIATAPTAAPVAVSGRVFSSFNRGISNAQVYLTDQNGNVRNARTNAFGYFRFIELEVGQTYIISARAKGQQFEQQVITPNDNLTNLNIWAK